MPFKARTAPSALTLELPQQHSLTHANCRKPTHSIRRDEMLDSWWHGGKKAWEVLLLCNSRVLHPSRILSDSDTIILSLKWAPDGKAGSSHLLWNLVSTRAHVSSYCLWAALEFLSVCRYDLEYAAVFAGSFQCVGSLSDLWWTYCHSAHELASYTVMIQTVRFPCEDTHTKHKYISQNGNTHYLLNIVFIYNSNPTREHKHTHWLL